MLFLNRKPQTGGTIYPSRSTTHTAAKSAVMLGALFLPPRDSIRVSAEAVFERIHSHGGL